MRPSPWLIALATAASLSIPAVASRASAQDATEPDLAFYLLAAADPGEPVQLLWTLPGLAWPAGGFRLERLEGERTTVLAEDWGPGSDAEALATLPPEAQQELGRGTSYFASSPWGDLLMPEEGAGEEEEGLEVFGFDEPDAIGDLILLKAFGDHLFARALGLGFVDAAPLADGRRYRVTALDADGTPIAVATAGPFDPARGVPLPPPPQQVEVRSERDGVVVSWQPPAEPGADVVEGTPSAVAYRVLRAVAPDGAAEDVFAQPMVVLSSEPTSTYVDAEAPGGASLLYSLRSVDPFGRSGPETPAVAVVHPDYAALDPPDGLQVEALPGRTLVTWEAKTTPATSGYRVSRSFNAQGPYEPLTEDPVGDPSFEDTSGRPGTTYFYAVQSVDGRGETGPHSLPREARFVRTAPLAPPAGLEATLGYGRILLRWTAGGDDPVAGYRVERSGETDDPFSVISEGLAPLPAFEDPFPPGATGTWRYRVVAIGFDDEESPPSEVLAVPLPRLAPPRPPRIVDADSGPDGVTLAWQPGGPEDEVVSWLVLRNTDARDPGPVVTVDPLPAGTRDFTDATAEPGIVYAYWVVAVDRAGNRSDPGGPVQLRPSGGQLPDPPAPRAEWVTAEDQPQPTVRLTFPPPPRGARWVVQRREADEVWLRIAGPFDERVEEAFDSRPPHVGPAIYRLVAIGADGRPGPAGPEVALDASPR